MDDSPPDLCLNWQEVRAGHDPIVTFWCLQPAGHPHGECHYEAFKPDQEERP